MRKPCILQHRLLCLVRKLAGLNQSPENSRNNIGENARRHQSRRGVHSWRHSRSNFNRGDRKDSIDNVHNSVVGQGVGDHDGGLSIEYDTCIRNVNVNRWAKQRGHTARSHLNRRNHSTSWENVIPQDIGQSVHSIVRLQESQRCIIEFGKGCIVWSKHGKSKSGRQSAIQASSDNETSKRGGLGNSNVDDSATQEAWDQEGVNRVHHTLRGKNIERFNNRRHTIDRTGAKSRHIVTDINSEIVSTDHGNHHVVLQIFREYSYWCDVSQQKSSHMQHPSRIGQYSLRQLRVLCRQGEEPSCSGSKESYSIQSLHCRSETGAGKGGDQGGTTFLHDFKQSRET
mmetsp:Transcript_18834/g.35745  ORF Transcript_18834/g.35745 Transcript_18834/m.35745 type:complete len:342 (+) Transcript_18834:1140-2165(+)